MAAGIQKYAVITEEAKDSAKDYREQRELIKAQNEEIAEVIVTGYEKRPVEIERVPDYARGVTLVVRTDTGETLAEVKMSEADRQESLPSLTPN